MKGMQPTVSGTMAAIGVAYLAQFARLARAQIMTLKGETFIEAARSLGAGNAHILFRHLLPNALAPVLVSAMLATGDAIILEATLGFFGLGAQIVHVDVAFFVASHNHYIHTGHNGAGRVRSVCR